MVETVESKKTSEKVSGARQDDVEEENDMKGIKQEIPNGEKLLLPIQCPLVDEFVGDIKENLATSNM